MCIRDRAYFLFLHNVDIQMPGSDGITVFGQAAGGGFIILALLCLDPKPSRFWFPITMAGIALLAAQVRSEWLGMAFALFIWGVLARKMTRVLMITAGMLAVLLIGYALDVNIPSPAERGGAISSREIVARGISAVSPELARDVTGSEKMCIRDSPGKGPFQSHKRCFASLRHVAHGRRKLLSCSGVTFRLCVLSRRGRCRAITPKMHYRSCK